MKQLLLLALSVALLLILATAAFSDDPPARPFQMQNSSQAPAMTIRPGGSAAGTIQSTGQSSFPTVQSINPAALSQGQSGTLTLSGRYLHHNMRIRLGAGITTGSLTVLNEARSMATVTFSVAADAAPGSRVVQVQYNDRLQPSPARVTVVGTDAPPLVRMITPDALRRGASYALTLTGSGLDGVTGVNFGPGITTAPPTTESNRLAVAITVAATAEPGPRQVFLVNAQGSHRTSASITVTADAAPAKTGASPPISMKKMDPPVIIKSKAVASPVTIQTITPNHWARGKTYQIDVSGSHFDDQLQADWGDGVAIEDLQIVSNTKLTMTVTVSGSASLGLRAFKLRSDASRPWTAFPAQAWVVAAQKWSKKKPVPQLIAPDLTVTFQGRITLLTPEGYLTSNEMYPEQLNEQTQFTWREENPGLAEWYEFRLVTENGFVIDKKRIDPIKFEFNGQPISALTNSFRMDTAYLLRLLTEDWKTHANVVHHGLSNIYIWWEVAGYRNYTTIKTETAPGSSQTGVAKTHKIVESKDVEVEISERRSLLTPEKPSGLACGGNGATASAIVISNTDKGNRAANYPEDQWELTGKLNIRSIPYATHINAKVKGAGDTAFYLPNLFLDWGDGSGAIALEIDLSQPAAPDLLPLGRTYHHRYQESGNYTVRIFVLPEDDIQQGPPDALASVYDSVSGSTQASSGTVVPSAFSYNPYFKVIDGIQKTAGADYAFSAPKGQQFQFDENSLYAQAARAHLIYCDTKKIAVREDLVAQGPLHLESVAINGYNGSGAAAPLTRKPSSRKSNSDPSVMSSAKKAQATAKPALTLTSNAGPSPGSIQAVPKPGLTVPVDTEISSCGILQGNADLVYYGEGRARITWSLHKGGTRMVVGSVEDALASPHRTENGITLTENTQNTPTAESYTTASLMSPVVEMSEQMIGDSFALVVEAEVLPQVHQLDQTQVLNLLQDARQVALTQGGSGIAKSVFSWLVPEAQAGSASFNGNPNVNAFQKSGIKLSVLAPSKEGSSGRPVMASLNTFAKSRMTADLEVKKEKPFYVQSDPFRYRVKPSAPEQPCQFIFPTSTGDDFAIRNLEVNDTGGNFSGSGVLDMHLYTGAGGTSTRYLLPVQINGWQVAADGLTVTTGAIDLPLDAAISEAGMRIQLKKLAARAKQTPMNLTLGAKPADTGLHLSGAAEAPEWTATAPLSEHGDWFYRENSAQEIEIGNSGFSITPQEIVLDLSARDGLAGNPGGAGNEWAGLHFGEDALLSPNLFEFQVPEANKGRVSNWGVEGTQLAGKAEITTPFSTPYKDGTISLAAISVDTSQNSLAVYHGMDVQVPWLDTHLRGDARLIHGVPGKEAYFDFTEISQDEIVKAYRGITMTVRHLLFGNFPQTGWGAWSETTTFRFEAEEVVFADNVIAPGIIYSMDGRPFLENGTTIDIPLGGKSNLGQTPIDLGSVRIDLHNGALAVFSFDFATTFSVSEVLSSVDVPVHYVLARDGKTYRAEGPRVSAFDLDIAFPAGQPRVTATVHIEYTGAGLSSSTAAVPRGIAWPFGVAEAHAASGAKDSFAGTVDMAMFDGPPVQAEFRLGYMGGHDYWLMRATLDMGTGVPFAPPFLKLYKIRGGLGHNFPLDAFKSAYPITVVTPVTDDSFLFMAGMQVGSSDGFICTMDGDLTIKPGDGARMDFRAWLLDAQHAGNGNFQGYFQYAAGGFDGMLMGHFSLLEDNIYFDIPENACTLHFGGNEPWHIYAGQEDGEKLRMHILIRDVDGYLMLDEESLRIGGGVYYYLGASIGHISGEIQTGLEITSEPHVSGYGKGGVHAEVCAHDVCVGTGISVRVDVSALPVTASAEGCVEIPIPLWNPEVCATFSL